MVASVRDHERIDTDGQLQDKETPVRCGRASAAPLQIRAGYDNAGGPTGQTGAEVTYQEKNILKTGEVMLVKDKRARNYLHPVAGTLGSDLGAGLFKKRPNILGKEAVLDER